MEMRFTRRERNIRDPDAQLFDSIEPVILGLKMALVELNVFRSKTGNVQVKVTICGEGVTGLEDCSKAHRTIFPRLELAFPGQDIYLEVSSPGIDRLIKDGSEFFHYRGLGVRVYRTDISDWTEGILKEANEKEIVLKGDSEITIPYEIIAKARLNGTFNKKTGG